MRLSATQNVKTPVEYFWNSYLRADPRQKLPKLFYVPPLNTKPHIHNYILVFFNGKVLIEKRH